MLLGKRLFWLVVIGALLLSACADRPTQVGDTKGDVLLALPRVTVDIGKDGTPSVAGMTPDMLNRFSGLTGMQFDASQMRMDPAYVDWFTRSDVQHVELLHKDDGIFIFENNKLLPHIGWNGESFTTAGDTLETLNVMNPAMTRVVKMLLPFAQRVGLDVAVRFPLKEGAKAIPLRDPGTKISEPSAAENTPGMVQARVYVTYNDQGIPSVSGLSTRDLEQAFGYSFRAAELDPAYIQQMMNSGIQHLTLRTGSNGIVLYVNGKALPSIVWGDEHLKNTSDLFGQLYSNAEFASYREVVSVLLPALRGLDADVVVKFPVPAGAKVIPVPTATY